MLTTKALNLRKFMNRLEVPHENHEEPTLLTNPDLEPMPSHRRGWGFFSFFGYWATPNLTIWTWLTGSSLLALGLNTGHVMGALTLGNVIICIYTCLNSNPGAKYHVGYTVCQRMIFGIYGSGIGIIIRVVLSIVFYGSQSWLGGLLLVVMFSSFSKGFMDMENTFSDSADMSKRDFIGFLVFHIIEILFLYMRPEKINKWLNGSCIITTIAFVAVLITCLVKNKGPGDIYYEKVNLGKWEIGWMWLKAITIWYGALSPDVTNQSDYSRFASSPRKMYLGIIIAIMITGTFVPLFSLICASATSHFYNTQFWLPTDIVLQWLRDDYSPGTRAGAFFLAFAFASSQLTFNVSANGFAGGMDLSGVCPKYINIRRGAIITALLSWLVQPWKFYNTSSVFMSVMSSFGVVVTPIIAILIADFMVIRKAQLPLLDLYSTSPDGTFYFTKGFNLKGISVWAISVALGIPGLIADLQNDHQIPQELVNFFSGNVIFAFILPFCLYTLVCKIIPVKNAGIGDKEDYFGAFTLEECDKLNIEPHYRSSLVVFDDGLLAVPSENKINKYPN